MNLTRVIFELNTIDDKLTEMLDKANALLLNESGQKSKKSAKPTKKFACALKVLYATKEYGCSGFEADSECLVCEFRR